MRYFNRQITFKIWKILYRIYLWNICVKVKSNRCLSPLDDFKCSRTPYIIWPFVLPRDHLINPLGICPLDFNTTRFRLYCLDIFRLPMEKTTGYSNMSKFLSCTVQPCQRGGTFFGYQGYTKYTYCPKKGT